MAYLLQHTAEAIDRKLELIAENKNLLPYPYEVDFTKHTALEDVGDGSVLITKTTDKAINLLLQDFPLSGGQYVVSLIITDIVDNVINTSSGCKLVIKRKAGTEEITLGSTTGTLELEISEETAALAYLEIPKGMTNGLLIKPQIAEAGTESGIWVPNMDKIGSYIDRRYNSLNTKVRELTKHLSWQSLNN